MGVSFHCSACADPVFPTPFVKRLILFALDVLWALSSGISSSYTQGFNSGLLSVPLVYVSIFVPVS